MLQRYFHCVLQYSRNIPGISSLSISSKSVSCILTNVCHRIIQLITKVGTNHQPTTTTSPNHVPLCCMHSCQVSPETVTPPLPWAACANSSPLFLKKKCFLISSLNLSWHNFFLPLTLPLVLSLLPGGRYQLPPHHNLLSGSCSSQ